MRRHSFMPGRVFFFFAVAFNRSLADYDLWGYLSFGRVLWQEGFFPYKDVFAYTPTKPLWVYHEWLTGVVFFGLVKFLGPASLQLLRYILALLTLCLIYETARKRGGDIFDVLIALVPSILLISFGYEPVRAQAFTFFFFTLTLFILECSKRAEKEKVLRWLPLIQIAWCNFHGGFVAGLGLIFLYALGESLTRRKIAVAYLKWGMIASLATLINPYGIDYLISLFPIAMNALGYQSYSSPYDKMVLAYVSLWNYLKTIDVNIMNAGMTAWLMTLMLLSVLIFSAYELFKKGRWTLPC